MIVRLECDEQAKPVVKKEATSAVVGGRLCAKLAERLSWRGRRWKWKWAK
jgi:hypothetical protein